MHTADLTTPDHTWDLDDQRPAVTELLCFHINPPTRRRITIQVSREVYGLLWLVDCIGIVDGGVASASESMIVSLGF